VSEIEAFPSAVLAHRWPEVPNVGDMLRLPDMVAAGEVDAPDVLVGGTPCQAFSVAGKRGSLEDERGALTLAYVELANEVDAKRRARGDAPCIIVWENVTGVLSTKDNAFGCFLAGLAGESEPLEPAGGKWSNAGAVFGPKRAVAWRVLDAQYFGVAQRRRRVFVVASARDGFDPCEILFEREGLRRDSAPSREAGQDAATDAGTGAAFSGMQDPVGTLCARDFKGVGNQFFNEGKVIAQRSAGYRMVAFGEYADRSEEHTSELQSQRG
jgi:DNA (cytosine-5)-methyltransferase 1